MGKERAEREEGREKGERKDDEREDGREGGDVNGTVEWAIDDRKREMRNSWRIHEIEKGKKKVEKKGSGKIEVFWEQECLRFIFFQRPEWKMKLDNFSPFLFLVLSSIENEHGKKKK